MDTHITQLDPEPLFHRSARLPDEPDLDHVGDSSAEPSVAPSSDAPLSASPRKRRGRLLAGVAVGALAVVASGVFLLSPLNTVVPIPSSVTVLAAQAKRSITSLSVPTQVTSVIGQGKNAIFGATSTTQTQAAEPGATPLGNTAPLPQRPRAVAQADALVAPAASLAATRVPHRPESISTPPYAGQPREQSLNELLKLAGQTTVDPHDQRSPLPASPATLAVVKSQAVTPPTRASAVAAISSNDAQEPGSKSPAHELVSPTKPPQLDITSAVTEAALGQPTISPPLDLAPAPAPAISLKPTMITTAAPSEVKPVLVASQSMAIPDLKADPAATKAPILVLSIPAGHQEQAEVLQFVTGLSTEVARLRTENETLRKDVARRIAEQDGRMSDLNRRISVAEARSALRSAADAGKSEDPQAEPTTRATASLPVTLVAQGAPARAPVQSPATRPRYHVQAASPGLALLAEIGRGGGEGAQLQVAVGDQVPGYGVVKSVAQRGPNWVVQTEHGPID